MIRIDKFLCMMESCSRSQARELIKKGKVTVNGQIVKQAEVKIHEEKDRVSCQGREISFKPHVYYMLNKPAGVVSATRDKLDRTVLDLLKNAPGKNLFPVGRLDKDTEGLLLVTNDGDLCHNLLSPAKHVPKTYLVKTAYTISSVMKTGLETGVDIGEDKPARPAVVNILEDKAMELTITEGKFHQVKRMLKAVGNEVIYLKRLSMGRLTLDETLLPGEYRQLTDTEIEKLRQG